MLLAVAVLIECDVPGTVVYMDGKKLGVAPVRIFSHEYAREYLHYSQKDWPHYRICDFDGGRGMELQTAKHGTLLLEFEPPPTRPNDIRCYHTKQGDRAFVRWGWSSAGDVKWVSRFQLIPEPHQPEIWVECDVPEVVVHVNGRTGQVTPFLIHGKKDATYSTELAAGCEGAELFGHYEKSLKFECRATRALAKEFDCYERDGSWWLKLSMAHLTFEPGNRVTLHRRAQAK